MEKLTKTLLFTILALFGQNAYGTDGFGDDFTGLFAEAGISRDMKETKTTDSCDEYDSSDASFDGSDGDDGFADADGSAADDDEYFKSFRGDFFASSAGETADRDSDETVDSKEGITYMTRTAATDRISPFKAAEIVDPRKELTDDGSGTVTADHEDETVNSGDADDEQTDSKEAIKTPSKLKQKVLRAIRVLTKIGVLVGGVIITKLIIQALLG